MKTDWDGTLGAYYQNGRRVTYAEVTTEDLKASLSGKDKEEAKRAFLELVRRGIMKVDKS